MRISVLSPSFSFSTFCPATDWKLIFTMARCHCPSACLSVRPSVCLCVCLQAPSLSVCVNKSWSLFLKQFPSTRRRAVLFSPLGCLSVCFCLYQPEVGFFFFLNISALKGPVRCFVSAVVLKINNVLVQKNALLLSVVINQYNMLHDAVYIKITCSCLTEQHNLPPLM